MGQELKGLFQMNLVFRLAVVTVVCAILPMDPCVADEAAERGRDILAGNRDAVVTLQIVINQKISFPGAASQNRESKSESSGTVISPDGLTLMSLSETDPSSIVEAMMAGSGQNVQMETEVRDIKILLQDGTEVPAEVILRDKDLDMAFVRPVAKPSAPLKYIDLENVGTPQVLDQVIALNRLGQVAGREYSASVERIETVVKRPRTLYIPGDDPTLTGLGSPVFTLDGKFVGVSLLRVVSGTGSGSVLGGQRDNVLAVIVPASDIAEGAAQAPPFTE